MIKNRKREFAIVCGGLLILGFLLLVSAPSVVSDTGNNTTINGSDGTIFNVAATPHRLVNGSMGYVQVNITTNEDTNKSFILSSCSGESYMELKDNDSVSLNTTMFNVPISGFNKSYNLTNNENNESVGLSVEFKENKLFDPLSDIIFPSPQSQIIVNTNIQDAVDAASDGDTVIIPSGVYKGEGNINVNISKNLTIKGDGDVVIDAEGNGRAFNINNTNSTGASKVNIIGLIIQNTYSGYDGGIGYGGAIFFHTNSMDSSSLIDCKFINSSGSNGGVVYCMGNISVKDCSFTNTRSISTSGGAVYFYNKGYVDGCNFTNTTSVLAGGAVYCYSGGIDVRYCNFNNTSSGASGGAICVSINSGGIFNDLRYSNFTNVRGGASGGAICFASPSSSDSVAGCNIVNCTSGIAGAGIYIAGTGNVSHNRFVNNTVNGGLNNINAFTGSCDYNWWGTNDINNAGISGSLPNNYYQIELSAANESTRDVNKTIGSFILPVPLGYKMCLNGTNNTGNISNLPDFNATIKLIDSSRSNGNFRSSLDLFRVSPFQMTPGDIVNVLAKESWVDTMNNAGSYIFSGLVDNQQLNISFAAERRNTSLSLTAMNITYEDNTNITATLTSDNGTGLINKNLTFNINGTDYNVTTNGLGVAVLNISGLHAGSYNVSVSFDGDDGYNPSTNNTTFNVGKRDTNLSLTANNITYGEDTNITAILTSDNGTELSNKTITFNINGTNHTATTDGSGVAVLNISGLHAGSYNVSVSFDGDDGYNPSTNNTTFNVGKRDTNLSLTANNITYGEDTNITAILTDSDGSLLSNKTITFNINGTNHTATTDGSGVAVLNISGLHAGSYNVTVSFDGDGDYNPSTNNTTFNVGSSPNPGPSPDPTPTPNGTTPNGTTHNGTTPEINWFDGLAKTGLPLVVLLLLCVFGLGIIRRK